MLSQKQSHKRRGFFASRAFVIAGFIITAFIIFANVRAFYRDRSIRQEIAKLEQQRQQLSQKKLESMEILQYVTSEDFVEETARTELNLKKPGERVIIVKSQDTQSELIENQRHIQTRQEKSNPVKWLYYFTHRSYEN